MAHQQNIPIRDARDRLIDLLGFGETYPLQDLPILDERLTVPFAASAKIPIEMSQLQVAYQLYDREDVPVPPSPGEEPIEAQGTGETLIIESPKISDDVTYKVRALKNQTGRFAYLHETATIKVGLDVGLAALILNTPFLDPALDNPKASDARIVDYGGVVQVKIIQSQEGVDYRLVHFDGANEIDLSETDVRGTLEDIVLSAKAVYEDTDIRIRATKTFDESEGRETQTALLDVVLPLKVRANTALTVAIDPTPIIGFKESTALKIEGTQVSTRYRVYLRKIADTDFVFGDAAGETLLKVQTGEGEDVQVRAPEQPPLWSLPDGFSAVGTQKAGTGAALSLPLPAMSDDSILIVQAEKRHQAPSPVLSAVKLAQAAVVLVKPDPGAALNLRVTAGDPAALGPVEVLGGQVGVFYYLRKDLSGADLALPAYFHKKDDKNSSQNKGLGQIRIGIDFVVPRTLPVGEAPEEADHAKIFPASAVLETAVLAAGTTLHFLAVKAQTRVSNPLLKTAEIATLPKIAFETAQVDAGKAAKAVVTASRVGDKYQLFLNGTPVRQARNGNGADLVFTTEAINVQSLFEMRITRPSAPGIPVVQIVPLIVDIRPAG